MKQLFKFLDEGKSPYHVIGNIVDNLQKAGCILLDEKDSWSLELGKSYCVVRGGTSIIAFSLPKQSWVGYRMSAAHSDSPTFKLKPVADLNVDKRYLKLNVEPYGGAIYSSWMDRPLSIAGRVLLANGDAIEDKLMDINQDLLVIPNLAIHMNRQCNQGVELNPQVNMLPLLGMAEEDGEKGILTLISKELGVEKEDILDYDLFLYPRQQALTWGYDEEFIMSPRLDDLECVFAIQKGFIEQMKSGDSYTSRFANMMIILDNEEVGSTTKQGANSSFLEEVLQRISEQVKHTYEERCKLLAQSFLISADNGHGVHPNHPEKSDATNRPYVNGGILIKYHSGQKYTTDGYSGAFIKKLCKDKGIDYQVFANRSDVAGGSTLGNILSSHISIPSADVGVPQLAMHSAVEVAGSKDVRDLETLFSGYYSAK